MSKDVERLIKIQGAINYLIDYLNKHDGFNEFFRY